MLGLCLRAQLLSLVLTPPNLIFWKALLEGVMGKFSPPGNPAKRLKNLPKNGSPPSPETVRIPGNPPYVSGGAREGGKNEENPPPRPHVSRRTHRTYLGDPLRGEKLKKTQIHRKGVIIIGFGTFKTLIVVIWTGRGSVYNRYTN